MAIDNETLTKKLQELEKSKAQLEMNLNAHVGAIQVLKQLLDDDKELGIPVERE